MLTQLVTKEPSHEAGGERSSVSLLLFNGACDPSPARLVYPSGLPAPREATLLAPLRSPVPVDLSAVAGEPAVLELVDPIPPFGFAVIQGGAP